MLDPNVVVMSLAVSVLSVLLLVALRTWSKSDQRHEEQVERLMEAHADQLERVLVLHRSESLDQYAAVEARMKKARLEDARDLMEKGERVGRVPLPEKRPSGSSLLWRRPPPVTGPAPESEE